MRKYRDPDKLSALDDRSGRVFIAWLYDEGASGTLSLSPAVALRFAAALRAAAYATGYEDPGSNSPSYGTADLRGDWPR